MFGVRIGKSLHASIVAVHNGRGLGGLGVKRITAGGASTGGMQDIFGTWTAPRLSGTNAAQPNGGSQDLEADQPPRDHLMIRCDVFRDFRARKKTPLPALRSSSAS